MMTLLQLPVLGAVLVVGLIVVGAAYRLYLSPLAHVPGPRLAALTYYYEFYYDVVVGAQFPWHIEQLHRRYGPIVRISPNEVHINDPDFVTTHFSSTSKLSNVKKDRCKAREHDFGVPNSIHSTTDHDIHKIRRRSIAPLFSKREVLAREEMVQHKVDLACKHLEAIKGTEQSIDLRLLFFCLGMDVLTEYSFPQGINFLGQDELVPAWRDMIVGALRKFMFFKHFHILWSVVKAIPPSQMLKVEPNLKIRFDWTDANRDIVKKIYASREGDSKMPETDSVFLPLLESDMPAKEKTFDRIWEESDGLLGAGIETISNVLGVIFFYILVNKETLARLRSELVEANATESPIPYSQLEKLPFLTAVITEGLRIAYGITARIMRVAPEASITYDRWNLPPGTIVSMSQMLQHRNEDLFPQASEFLPERWLDGSADKTHLLTFSKGPRQCLGINLAYMEIYLAVATILLRYDVSLFETTMFDVLPAVDCFQPMPSEDSKGIRISVS